MQVAVVGMGNLGTAVANHIAGNGHNVIGWEYNAAVVEEINQQHSNSQYLPGISLPRSISACTQLPSLLAEPPELILVTLPSLFIKPVFSQFEITVDLPLVVMTKGINSESGETVCQLLRAMFPRNELAQLSGPSIANELACGGVTSFVAASKSEEVQKKIAVLFNSQYVSIQCSSDIVGVELGGILKNCYALGLAIVDQSERAGLNFKGAFFSLALQEMSALAVRMGGSEKTFTGISGLGDLLATALSEDSHNRKMGKLLAKDLSLKQITEQMGVLAEGYNSLAAILQLAAKNKLKMPLALLIKRLIDKEIEEEKFFVLLSDLLKN